MPVDDGYYLLIADFLCYADISCSCSKENHDIKIANRPVQRKRAQFGQVLTFRYKFMEFKDKKFLRDAAQRPSAGRMVEDVLGCKWSLTVLQLVRQGICRPGAMERSVEGLTTKVLNERLKKLVRYEVLLREAYPEIPPRVEYTLSPFGKKFVDILEAIRELDNSSERTNT